MLVTLCIFLFFFFNDTATTEIYTLSLHDALPISQGLSLNPVQISGPCGRLLCCLHYEHDFYVQQRKRFPKEGKRSEEHTSELQSRLHLVCRLLLEKKKKEHHKNTRKRIGLSSGTV